MSGPFGPEAGTYDWSMESALDERVQRWRFLVGLGVSQHIARQLVVSNNDHELDRLPIHADTEPSGVCDDRVVALLDRLDMLSDRQRSSVLSAALGLGETRPVDPDALASAAALLEVGGATLTEVLTPITELDAPDLRDVGERGRRPRVAITVAVALAIGLLGVAARQQPPAATIAVPSTVAELPNSRSPTTTTTTSIAPPPTWIDPDREVEIFLTDEDTIVRLEPWTRRLLWESRPFRDPQIISIDPNSVTIDSAGNRLIVSLADGTLLPP